jgi:nicotinamidase/pyrazinamidase
MTMIDAGRRHFLKTAAAGLVLTGVAGCRSSASTPGARMKPGPSDVLIVVDVQNCFVPGGTLPVKEGDQIVPLVNRIAKAFDNVVLTMDWHTAGHASFASSHPGKKPFETIAMPYGTQVLWPDHCVQGTLDADLVPGLSVPHAQLLIRKGYRRHIDSYSAFLEADGRTRTGLSGYMKDRRLERAFLVGLATDFCVAWSALDARKSGFEAVVIEDATRGIDTGGSLGKAWADMTAAGVRRVQSRDLEIG